MNILSTDSLLCCSQSVIAPKTKIIDSTDKSTQSSKYNARSTIGFGIGVHYGAGVIVYNAEQHTYDYSGPSVDGAAQALDKTQPGQNLVTEVVSDVPESKSGSFDQERFEPFSSISLRGATVHLRQFNPAKLPVRVFEDKVTDEANVDSLSAALEQQASGLTQRRVVTLAVRLPSIADELGTLSRDDFVDGYKSKITKLDNIAKDNLGHLVATFGNISIISFNAMGPTPAAPLKAFKTLQDVRAELDRNATGGVAAERSLTGMIPVNQRLYPVIVTPVVNMCMYLERLARKYHQNAMVFASFADDVSCFAESVEFIDFVNVTGGKRPVAVVSVGQMAQSADDDEWMYSLQKGNDANTAAPVNAIFETLTSEDPAKLPGKLDELSHEAKDGVGYANLRKIVERVASSLQSVSEELAHYAESNPNSM